MSSYRTFTVNILDTKKIAIRAQWTIPFLAKRGYLVTLCVLVIRSFQSDFEQIVHWIANKMCITCHENVPLTS